MYLLYHPHHHHHLSGEKTNLLVVPYVNSNRSVEEVLNHVNFQPQSISRIHSSFFTAHQKSQTTRSYKFLSVLAPRSVGRVFGSWCSTTTNHHHHHRHHHQLAKAKSNPFINVFFLSYKLKQTLTKQHNNI